MGDVFKVRGSTSEDFEKHIKDVREQWGTLVRDGSEVRCLPNVDGSKARMLKLEGDHGILTIVFRQRDAYKIAWGTDRLFIFCDSLEYLKEVIEKNAQENKKNITKKLESLVQELLAADEHELKSDYRSLGDRKRVQIGREALLKAVNILSQPKSQKEVKDYSKYLNSVAESCLVIIIMFAECLRFDDMLKYAVEKYDTGGKVTPLLSDMLNDWSKISKDLNDFWNNPKKLTELEKQLCSNVMLVMFDSIFETT